MGFADIGTAAVQAQHLRETDPDSLFDTRYGAPHFASGAEPNERESMFDTRYDQPRFASGFTQPTLIYDQMRRMDLDATSLDVDYSLHVVNPQAKASWAAWFRDWKTFFAKTLTTSGKFANIFASDDLREIVNSRDLELRGFHDLYNRQLDAAGQPVPQSTSPGAPPPLSQPGARDKEAVPAAGSIWTKIPWWVYGLTIVTAGGIGYSFYRAAKQAKARAEWGERYVGQHVVPRLLPGSEPMPLSYDHDPAPAAAQATVAMPPLPPSMT